MAIALHDEIAKRSIELYSSLPQHGKPRVRDNGVPEWTILATISLVRRGQITPISLGAGVKVLPATRLPPLGDTVHDCHAEILARRGFVRWLIEEARKVKACEPHSGALRRGDSDKLRWSEEAEVWLYVSALPCGDASTLHTAAHQPADMASLKSSDVGQLPTIQAGQAIRGRNGYESFGAIRTKPGRADSNPTICMSCSDKIASWNVLGLQGALLSEIFEAPIYLDGIVIGGVERELPASVTLSDAESWWDTIRNEVLRSLYGRIQSIQAELPAPYQLVRPPIHLTDIPFPLSKPTVMRRYPNAPEPVPNVQCILHVPSLDIAEVLHQGCKSGGSWKAPGDQLISPKARSSVCKYELLRAYLAIPTPPPTLPRLSHPAQTYFSQKHQGDSVYQQAKAILRGAIGPPQVLADFEKCGPFSITTPGIESGGERQAPPFAGWIVSGQRWESFTVEA